MDEKKKKSIHDISDTITDKYTIEEIEKAFHPRAKEKIQEELEDLVNAFAKKHHDLESGSIKDPEKAVDDFMLMFAKYHFGDAYETLKKDKKQLAKVLEDTYGIRREDLKEAFSKKGVYNTIRSIFERHVDPIVDAVLRHKQEGAQRSLNTYLHDEDTVDELRGHIQTRTGRRIRPKYLKLQDAVNIISSYMAMPGSEKVLGKSEEKIGLPDEVAGRPEIHDLFEGGAEAHKVYREVPGKVDTTHRFGGKKYKKAA